MSETKKADMNDSATRDGADIHPHVAVSACLLGQRVRYDGGHTRDRFVAEQLGKVFKLTSVCPELEAGMGVPRPSIHLRRVDGKLHLVSRDGSEDYTDRIAAVAERRSRTLESRISGFILKNKSPTCGMERVPVANADGVKQDRSGTGMFVQHFTRLAPLVPIEEQGRLHDPVLRENFIERVYAFARWQALPPDDVAGFIEFHARHKLMLMARGSECYARLGRIVAGVTAVDLSERRERYIQAFMSAMRERASRKRHYNVLQHVMGYFKRQLDSEDKQELLALLDAYRNMQVPLATPVALMHHYLRKYPDGYLSRQHYLAPYSETLGLRAHI